MTDRLKDKVCIVTGGAKGLGRAYCKAMAGQGATVVIADIADGTALARDIGATYIHPDVSKPDSAENCVTATVEQFGTIDVLVNNAALYSVLPNARYDEIDFELWDAVMAVNVRGAFAMIRFAAPVMEAQSKGKIINITSATTYKGLPGMLHYISSKGALVAMTRALSRELGGKNICVNNLAPGLVLSDSIEQNPDHVARYSDRVLASRALKRHGHPRDLIGALIFLASDESDFVTGQTIVVDGGSVNS
jgi:NAD(P)-dependent dehydrogenase (short-subunit alcohol dehydrogenase family)